MKVRGDFSLLFYFQPHINAISVHHLTMYKKKKEPYQTAAYNMAVLSNQMAFYMISDGCFSSLSYPLDLIILHCVG